MPERTNKGNGFLLLLKDWRLTIALVGVVVTATVGWMNLQAQADETNTRHDTDVKVVEAKLERKVNDIDFVLLSAKIDTLIGTVDKMGKTMEGLFEEIAKSKSDIKAAREFNRGRIILKPKGGK